MDRAAGGLQPARRRARPHAQDEAPRRPPEEPRARREVLRLKITVLHVLHCLYILHLYTKLKYILVRTNPVLLYFDLVQDI